MLSLIDGIQPRILGLQEMLSEFIKHRQSVVRRRTEFELKKAKSVRTSSRDIRSLSINIDEVIKTIRASKTQDIAEKALIKQVCTK
jgi:DNA gyrase subunit A